MATITSPGSATPSRAGAIVVAVVLAVAAAVTLAVVLTDDGSGVTQPAVVGVVDGTAGELGTADAMERRAAGATDAASSGASAATNGAPRVGSADTLEQQAAGSARLAGQFGSADAAERSSP